MSGTVAVGNALAGATVTITDVNGKTATATSGAGGVYTVSLAGLTAPFIISATVPSGVSTTLYSVVASTATTGGAALTVNVTPLTTAVAALLAADGDPVSLTQSGASSAVTPASVSAAIAKLDAALGTILTANGLSPASFDPIGGTFTTDQTGADAVIDSVSVTPSVNGKGLQLASLADPNTPITLSSTTSVSTPLKTPAQPASYLSSLVTSLSQCMADVQGGAAASASTACSSALDAKYLNNGMNFAQRHSLFMKGTTLQGVKTVAFLPAGTLPAITNAAALVYFLITQANGTQNFASDIVQQLPNGSWDIIGNQAQFAPYIASFVGRVQYLDKAHANNGRYESGLMIQIPTVVTVNGTSTAVGSALVQGPGLPANGVYMLGGNSGFGPYLRFPVKAVTAPPQKQMTNPSWPDVGMSDQYKWSWAGLSAGSSVTAPSTADYASAQADVSKITQFGVYTVTFYDYSGNQLGTPQKVLNIAANADAATGATVPWPTLGNDVVASLLTPGGAGAMTVVTAQSGKLPSATIDWTVPSAALSYPNTWVRVDSQSPEQFTNNVETYQAQAYGVMNGLSPTINGTTYSSTISNYVDQLTTGTNIYAQASAQVQIGWQADGRYYTSTSQYNN
jgi:glucoamylase